MHRENQQLHAELDETASLEDALNMQYRLVDLQRGEIETLRSKLAQWESVFGHLGDTPDACGNAIHAKYEEYEAEIERLRTLAGHGRWEITASDCGQYLYVQHDWAGGHGQVQIKAEAEGYVVDIFDDGDNVVASTSAMYSELSTED